MKKYNLYNNLSSLIKGRKLLYFHSSSDIYTSCNDITYIKTNDKRYYKCLVENRLKNHYEEV